MPAKVQQVGGTLWNGFMVVNYPRPPFPGNYAIEWDLHPLSLLGLNLASTVSVKGAIAEITGRFHLGLNGYGVRDLNGEIASALVNTLLRQQGVTASGQLQLKGLELVVADSEVSSATGELFWEGGAVTYQQGRNKENLNFPPVRGNLKGVDGGILLTVVEAAKNQVLAEASLTRDAVGGVRVFQRVLRIAGMQGSGPDDKSLLSLQQPLDFSWGNPLSH
jgi:hypothetical protein